MKKDLFLSSEEIKYWRFEYSVSENDAARIMGVSISLYRCIEAGFVEPDQEQIRRFLEALDLSEDFFCAALPRVDRECLSPVLEEKF